MLFVANWKMFFTTSQALSFFMNNEAGYADLVKKKKDIIILPSFTAIALLRNSVSQSGVLLGSQSCTGYEPGAFTGAISTEDLVDIGCSYCLVGHSEQRLYFKETDEDVAHNVLSLIKKKITPIICVGESKEERNLCLTKKVVQGQLESIIKSLPNEVVNFCIAYEPIWAIGTGVVPTNEQIEEVFGWIIASTQEQGKNLKVQLLYGGSISSKNCIELGKIPNIGGFLIGKASLDFQEFEKIVNYTTSKA